MIRRLIYHRKVCDFFVVTEIQAKGSFLEMDTNLTQFSHIVSDSGA